MSDTIHEGSRWATYEQQKLEIESALRCKISDEITKFADHCRERGMNGHFTSALDLAANMALLGPYVQNQDEGEVISD